MELVVAGAAKSGRPWNNAQHYKRWLEEIGFEDVVEKRFYLPMNMWPKGDYFKQLSLYCQADLLRGLEAISLRTIGAMGWSAEEIRDFLPGVRRDIHDTSIHAYLPLYDLLFLDIRRYANNGAQSRGLWEEAQATIMKLSFWLAEEIIKPTDYLLL